MFKRVKHKKMGLGWVVGEDKLTRQIEVMFDGGNELWLDAKQVAFV